MRPRIHPLLPAAARCFTEGGDVVIATSADDAEAGILSFRRAGDGGEAWTNLTLMAAPRLEEATFRWSGEVGLDGVQFEFTPAVGSSPPLITVSGW